MRLKTFFFVALGIWVAGPVPALATVAIRQSHREMALDADVVAQGQVESVESRRSPDGKRIFTSVRMKVEDTWKGAPAEALTIQVPGGASGDIAQVVQGAPAFEPGERVVVFLDRRDHQAPFFVVGLSQGKLSIRHDPTMGEVAVPDLRGLELVDKETRTRVQPLEEGPIPLRELKNEVLAAGGG